MSLTVGIVWDIQELLSVVEFHVYNRWSGKQIMRIAGQEHGLLFVKPDGPLPSCIFSSWIFIRVAQGSSKKKKKIPEKHICWSHQRLSQRRKTHQ